ncbi:MAG: hypothetical protein ACLR6B_08400 [Blautia sp.]
MASSATCLLTIVPALSTRQNNRDHRKIVVIDGKVAFTGGCQSGR